MYTLSNFLRSKTFIKNFIYANLVVVFVLTCVYFWLSSYTDHGENVDVPDMRGKNYAQAKSVLENLNLRVAIMDSVFDMDKPKGSIIEQSPSKGAKVKEHRTVYLTLNAFKAPDVTVPNLKDASLRQAKAMLEVVGLVVGNIHYTPDIAKNAVLRYSFAGEAVSIGTHVPFGSKIDLTVGNGLAGDKITLPCLFGMNRKQVRNKLREISLSLGGEVFDASVTDSSAARIYKQTPNFSLGATINKGSSVDLYYTDDESKIPETPDTTSTPASEE